MVSQEVSGRLRILEALDFTSGIQNVLVIGLCYDVHARLLYLILWHSSPLQEFDITRFDGVRKGLQFADFTIADVLCSNRLSQLFQPFFCVWHK